MAEKTGFILHYDMLENIKILGNDIAIEVLTALSNYDQGLEIGTLSPQAQFAVNAYIPALKKSKKRWETSVKNGYNHVTDNLPEPSDNLDEANNNLPEPSDNQSTSKTDFESGVLDPVLVPVPENANNISFPTACAVDQKGIIPISDSEKTKIASVSQPPPKKRGLVLTDEQKLLFQAAKACFESSEKAKAIMYQDKGSTQMHMENLKLFVARCSNMAPGITADFMRNVLEHFKVLVNRKLRGKTGVEFTPRALITPWIWETVIGSLPEPDNELTAEIMESIGRMFKK